MEEYSFDMKQSTIGQGNNLMVLLQDGENLYLSLKSQENKEIMKIKVLPISKVKKLTNFFMKGFQIPLKGKKIESLVIPDEELMEAERKIIVTGENAEEKVQHAIQMLEENFEGKRNEERADYVRNMIYLDTPDSKLRNNNQIFRLTQENDTVKATIHMDNHLSGDEKRILKFFFTETSMPLVVKFFQDALSVKPITKPIPSNRKEYETSFGEVAIDKIEDENVKYYSIELELDKFMDESRDSKKVNEAAQKIAKQLGLEDCKIVDLGTEAIYEEVSGKDFFEANSVAGEREK